MEEKFRTTVEHIFNNWTGLQLAVEHAMGGPNSRQVAIDCVNYMTGFCLNEPNIEVEDIQEALEDIMNQEFNTICEDKSPAEIANLLSRFLLLLKNENLTQYDLEYSNLPVRKLWLGQPQKLSTNPAPESEMTVEDDVSDALMDQDPEWTEVKSRRKK